MIKVFVSYTLRDKKITQEMLENLKYILNKLERIESYIDIIDNKNVESPQDEVVNNLLSSNIIWVINSKCLNQSKWVELELAYAKTKKKPIYYIEYSNIIKMSNFVDLDCLKNYIKNFVPIGFQL